MSKKQDRAARHAFAILLYRLNDKGKVEVFLAQANGPKYWRRQQDNCWGLPKGRSEIDETPFQSAAREFQEEIGAPLPTARYKLFMRHIRPEAQRMVTVFVAQVNGQDVSFGGSNLQTKQWPPKSGHSISYAEIVDAKWFSLKKASRIILPGQRPILKKLKQAVKTGLLEF